MPGKTIEKIKNVILVVLFLATILLLYLLWTQESRSSFRLADILPIGPGAERLPAAEEIAAPVYAAFSDGSSGFRLAEGALAPLETRAAELVRALCAAPNVGVSEIEQAQYDAVLARFNSVRLVLPCEIPFADFAAHYGVRTNSSFDAIGGFSELAFTDATKESVLLRDASGRCFRVLSPNAVEGTAALREISRIGSDVYYASAEIFGGAGRALIPLSSASDLAGAAFEPEADAVRGLRVEMAEAVFGENFDFVRRISDGFGNITYMYGYGQRTFTAGASGVFEYSAEAVQSDSGDFYEDLETAARFIASCGGWLYDEDGENALVLAAAETEGSGRRMTHRYRFAQRAAGALLLGEDGYAVEVDVVGGQVSRYRRNAVALRGEAAADERPTAEPANVIASNCNHIYNVLNNNTLAAAAEEALSFSAEAAEALGKGFFVSEKDERIIPCWILTARGGTTFFFDLYDASPLGFRRQAE